jgi:uncharacterized MAPEG superfamily protein
MSLPYSASSKEQKANIHERVLFDKPSGIHLRAADRDANWFEVIEAAVFESLWNAGGCQESFSASGALAAAGFYTVAFYKLPSSASTIGARRKL